MESNYNLVSYNKLEHELGLLNEFEEFYNAPSVKTIKQIPTRSQTREMAEVAVKPSKMMRSVQYVIDNNVIRFWNNDILSKKIGKVLDVLLPLE